MVVFAFRASDLCLGGRRWWRRQALAGALLCCCVLVCVMPEADAKGGKPRLSGGVPESSFPLPEPPARAWTPLAATRATPACRGILSLGDPSRRHVLEPLPDRPALLFEHFATVPHRGALPFGGGQKPREAVGLISELRSTEGLQKCVESSLEVFVVAAIPASGAVSIRRCRIS